MTNIKQQSPKDWEFQIRKFINTINDLKIDLTDNEIEIVSELFVQCDMLKVAPKFK